MSEMVKEQIPCFSMKMRLYPSDAQKEKIDRILRALHVAYNITFHEVFQMNPLVCTEPNGEGKVWPDFSKMANKSWLAYLKECNPIIAEAPAASLSTNNGLFLSDAKRAWETGMNRRPVSAAARQDFRFYNTAYPRRSFMIQLEPDKIIPSEENSKVAWIRLPKIEGKIKARGFNNKLTFGDNGEYTYSEAVLNGLIANKLTVRVSKDRCGDYFISITFSDGKKHDRKLYRETRGQNSPQPVGIDVGIKDVAILSNGTRIENKHFKKEKDRVLRKMNRQLSRRWGPANIAFREYNGEIRKENKRSDGQAIIPLSVPSKRYLHVQSNKARLERKIARRRDTYYHQTSAEIVRQSSMIAVETLQVKNMLRNHKLAYALSDAAMSEFISKVKYKAERAHIALVPIGMFEPSSQMCSVCGELYPPAKNLSVREWTCPRCETRHNRDINAAKNILAIATVKGAGQDDDVQTKPGQNTKKGTGKPVQKSIFPDYPSYTIVYSKELSRAKNVRYVIVDKDTKEIIDNAQGAGYRSIANAKNCFKAKKKWSKIS